MSFKDLKLGWKLGIGFGILIIISMFLGILAIVNMNTVSTKAKYLDEEYVPEVEIANNIETAAREAMYANRGWSYSNKSNYYNEGQLHLQRLHKYLEDAKELDKNSEQLDKLSGAIEKIDENLHSYEQLLAQSVESQNKLEATRARMDESANNFMTYCTAFLNSQDTEFNQDVSAGAGGNALRQRMDKIVLMNRLIDIGNEIRVINWKEQATHSDEGLDETTMLFNEAEKIIENIGEITFKTVDIQQIDKILSALTHYQSAMTEYKEEWSNRLELNKNRDVTADLVLKEANLTATAGIEQTLDISQQTVDILDNSSVIMAIGLIIALITGVFLAYVFTNLITKPMFEGVAFAKEIAKGNLEAKLNVMQDDEIGDLADALREMVDQLKDIVENVVTGSNSIADASREMSTTSQQMSQGASEQASAAEEVSSSMEQMSANIQQNTDNAQQTEKIAVFAADGIRKGNESSQRAVEAMKNIAEKISIINEIAFQTNILALNAAVEAARAGEHGKGFAVVAAEVRKLAERSREAASEIDNVSRDGVQIATEAGKLLSEIAPEIEKTSRLVQEISAASIEQSSGASQVNNAIQQLNQVTQQNAASSEELATSSEELSGQAEQLKDIVGFFKIEKTFQTSKINLSDNKTKKETTTKTPKYENINKNSDDEKSGVKLDLHSEDIDNEYEKF